MSLDEENPAEEGLSRQPVERMSKTPSWVMLGFVLGAAFVYALMRTEKPESPAMEVRIIEEPRPQGPREPAPLTEIEAVFAVWGEHAVWSDGVTEVAYWNRQEKAFSDFFEVRLIGGIHYFRSIPMLTRRVIRHGKALPNSPLQFTETEEQYREWREHGRIERRDEGELKAGGKGK